MKSVYILIVVILFSTVIGCNPFKSDHPQAALSNAYTTDLNAKTITQYAESIDKQIPLLQKTTSLVYMLGDLSFYVEKYAQHDQAVLMVEHTISGGMRSYLKRYYFRNDSLILEVLNNQLGEEDGPIVKDRRTYLRNNTVFKLEERSASPETAIKSLPYINLSLTKAAQSDQSHLENIKTLNQVLAGADRFDMVFESITTYPDSRYIVLRSKVQNSYTASILVNEKDALIDSLLNSPSSFKDQKLNFNWIVKDQEAIYVPVASNTSANGLNR